MVDEMFQALRGQNSDQLPLDDAWPIFIRKYGMQWSGCAPGSVSDPDNPRKSFYSI